MQAAIEMPPRGPERSGSPPNITHTPMEETLTVEEMSTTQSTRKQLRKPPTIWKLSLFETGQEQIIEVPEGQARIYIIGDADAWSALSDSDSSFWPVGYCCSFKPPSHCSS